MFLTQSNETEWEKGNQSENIIAYISKKTYMLPRFL